MCKLQDYEEKLNQTLEARAIFKRCADADTFYDQIKERNDDQNKTISTPISVWAFSYDNCNPARPFTSRLHLDFL